MSHDNTKVSMAWTMEARQGKTDKDQYNASRKSYSVSVTQTKDSVLCEKSYRIFLLEASSPFIFLQVYFCE